MTTNWLVCVDETPSGTFAFESLHRMAKEDDQIYVLHVAVKGLTNYFESTEKVENKGEEEIKKVLTFYGKRAQERQLKVTLIGTLSGPAHKRINRAVRELKIHHLILGKRPQNWLRSLTSSSTSKEVMENAECNVTVAKQTPGTSVPDEKAFRSTLDAQEISCLRRSDQIVGGKEGKSKFVCYTMKGSDEQMRKPGIKEEGVKRTESPRETERPTEGLGQGVGKTEGGLGGREGKTEGRGIGMTEGVGMTEGRGLGRTEGGIGKEGLGEGKGMGMTGEGQSRGMEGLGRTEGVGMTGMEGQGRGEGGLGKTEGGIGREGTTEGRGMEGQGKTEGVGMTGMEGQGRGEGQGLGGLGRSEGLGREGMTGEGQGRTEGGIGREGTEGRGLGEGQGLGERKKEKDLEERLRSDQPTAQV